MKEKIRSASQRRPALPRSMGRTVLAKFTYTFNFR